MSLFRSDSKVFARRIDALGTAWEQVDSKEPETVVKAKKALIASRIAYKRIEYFPEYFLFTSSRIYNRAPKAHNLSHSSGRHDCSQNSCPYVKPCRG